MFSLHRYYFLIWKSWKIRTVEPQLNSTVLIKKHICASLKLFFSVSFTQHSIPDLLTIIIVSGTPCLYDSGSPLVCEDMYGNRQLYGIAIAIHGPEINERPCTPGKQISVFIRVPYYAKWIIKTIKNANNGMDEKLWWPIILLFRENERVCRSFEFRILDYVPWNEGLMI